MLLARLGLLLVWDGWVGLQLSTCDSLASFIFFASSRVIAPGPVAAAPWLTLWRMWGISGKQEGESRRHFPCIGTAHSFVAVIRATTKVVKPVKIKLFLPLVYEN